MTELEAQEALVRANEAAQVLNHKLVQEALNALRADLFVKLTDTNWRQRSAREAIYHQLKAIDNFEAQFRFHLTNGKVAATWLEERRAMRELRKSRKASGIRP